MSQQVEERKVRFEPQMRKQEGDGRKLVHGGFAWASQGLRQTGPGILGRHLVRRLKTFEAMFERRLKTNTERRCQKQSYNML